MFCLSWGCLFVCFSFVVDGLLLLFVCCFSLLFFFFFFFFLVFCGGFFKCCFALFCYFCCLFLLLLFCFVLGGLLFCCSFVVVVVVVVCLLFWELLLLFFQQCIYTASCWQTGHASRSLFGPIITVRACLGADSKRLAACTPTNRALLTPTAAKQQDNQSLPESSLVTRQINLSSAAQNPICRPGYSRVGAVVDRM